MTKRKQPWEDLGNEHSRGGNKGIEVQEEKVVAVGRCTCSFKSPGWRSPSPPSSPLSEILRETDRQTDIWRPTRSYAYAPYMVPSSSSPPTLAQPLKKPPCFTSDVLTMGEWEDEDQIRVVLGA